MLEWLQGIADFLNSIVQDLLRIVAILTAIATAAVGWFAFFPAEIIELTGILITLVIAYKILGREG